MALDLDPRCKARLIDSVTQNLAHVRVNGDMFLDAKSIVGLAEAEKILPGSGKIRDKMNQYVGEMPLFEFIDETSSRDISENAGWGMLLRYFRY